MSNLPKPLDTYFALEPGSDPSLLDGLFAADASVNDERQTHHGIAAIKAWRDDVMKRTPSTARPLSLEERDGRLVVLAEVSGDFPGSPVTLDHFFTLRDGRIATLEIK